MKKELFFDSILLCLAFLTGIILLKNAQILPKNHISKYFCYKNSHLYLIKGIIDSEPINKNNKIPFIFKTEEIQLGKRRHNCSGRIMVYTRERIDLRYGDELILCGSLGKNNFLRQKDIWGILRIKGSSERNRLNRTRRKR